MLIFPDGSGPALLSAMIAGIPYNKAHILEFSPGEIRLNVTMASTQQLFKQKLQEDSNSYAALVERGKVELQRLRSLKEEDIVTKKDIMMENERLAVEADYERKTAERAAREETDQQIRQARQRELEVARLERKGIPADEARLAVENGETGSIPPVLVGGAFVACAAVALSTGGREKVAGSELQGGNATEAVPPVRTTGLPDIRRINLNSNGPSSVDEEFYTETSGIDRLTAPPVVNGASSLFSQLAKSEEERKQDARKAMEEYLDQDDGGEAWLRVMSDIIDDDVEEDVSINGSGDASGFGKINGSSL